MTENQDILWTTEESDAEIPSLCDDLWVEYQIERGVVKAVRGVSFDLRPRREPGAHRREWLRQDDVGRGPDSPAGQDRALSRQGEITYWRDGAVPRCSRSERRETAPLSLARVRDGFPVGAQRLQSRAAHPGPDVRYDAAPTARCPRVEMRQRALELLDTCSSIPSASSTPTRTS